MAPKNEGLITKAAELAKQCDVSTTTAANWRRQPDFPGGEKGPWDLAKVKNWIHADPARSAAAMNRREPGSGKTFNSEVLQAIVVAFGRNLMNDRKDGLPEAISKLSEEAYTQLTSGLVLLLSGYCSDHAGEGIVCIEEVYKAMGLPDGFEHDPEFFTKSGRAGRGRQVED